MVKIKSAAIMFFNLDTQAWQIVTGKSHATCYHKMYEQGIRYDKKRKREGFVTSQGDEHFVNRSCASYIAWKAGQIKEIPKDWMLFSERIDWSK